MSHVWTSQAVMAALHRLTDSTNQVRLVDVVRESGLTNRQVADACTKLVSHKYLVRLENANGNTKRGCFKLTPDGRLALEAGAKLSSGPKGPHGKPRIVKDTLRDKVWRLLRIRHKLSVSEAVGVLCDADATNDTLIRTANNVQKYLRALRATGYLNDLRREAGTSPNSNGFKRYYLARDTGPLAPVKRNTGRVYDQNEEREYDIVA